MWRLVWLTTLLAFLLPLSRTWALRKNFSLAMWLHIGVAVGYFIDSFRRKTHPHVWILNTSFFVWYILDRMASVFWYRVRRDETARKIFLDKNYILLLWKQSSYDKRISDLYWLKENSPGGRRYLEWSHPFTVASAHHVKVPDEGDPRMSQI